MPRTVTAASLVLSLTLVAASNRPAGAAPTPDDEQKPREISQPTRTINRALTAAWEEQQLQPAPKTSDYQFVRRVYLDLVGRIATSDEVRTFVRDGRADKRIRLVEQLLRHPDFARNWAGVWTRILLPRPVPPAHFDQLHSWLTEQFKRDLSYKELFLRLLTATERNSDNGAAVYVLSHLGAPVPPEDRAQEGPFTMESLTDHSCRTFLGIKIDCCRCHDHPFTAELKQSHWWGLNAFFRQVESVAVPGKPGQAPIFLLRDNPELNKDGRVFYPKRNGAIQFTRATFLDGTPLKPNEVRPRRQVLAEMMVKHPQFSRTLVNRVWTHLLGQSMNQLGLFDDSGEHNPVVLQDLLELLTGKFEDEGYDLKKLLLWICTSDAYQLQFRPTKEGLSQGTAVYCTSMKSKLLGPEQRLGSILTALRAREVLAEEQLARLRKGWLATQVPEYPAVEQGCCCEMPIPVIPLLEGWRFLYESQELHDALCSPQKGALARILAGSGNNPDRILDEIFLATLNRPANPNEVARIQKEVQALLRDKKDLTPLWQDLLWVLLHGSEFLANY
jgi:hypothetical protein